ncbi:LptF/LptG family permease [Sulfurimonas sp. MAG313]|nr:LptF/LptG family permease [Sulfurimonas sp. MAG313]MDF1880329.1 LptF/LptG family permease [Sulfurimonas sp. MAG313]
MLTFKTISFLYLKYVGIIVMALVLFFVGFDVIDKLNGLPDSANLKLLYTLFRSYYALDILFPISLIFAMIATKISLIRSNSLVAYYSLGYSKADVLRPFTLISTLLILMYILAHMYTPFAKGKKYSDNIYTRTTNSEPTQNLFFTYKDYYVYFQELRPLQKRAHVIRIFNIKDNDLNEVIVAQDAVYIDDYWTVKDAKKLIKPHNIGLKSKGIIISDEKDLKLLKGFRPKLLDQVYEGSSSYTILDAFEAIQLLDEQNVNTNKVKSVLYKTIIYPFFVPFVVIIIFFFVPISPRFLNVTLFSFGALLSTLLIWGMFYMLIQLSNAQTISGELGIVLPVFLLGFLSAFVWYKKANT